MNQRSGQERLSLGLRLLRQRIVTVASRLPGGHYALRSRPTPYDNVAVQNATVGANQSTGVETTHPENPGLVPLSNQPSVTRVGGASMLLALVLHATKCSSRAQANGQPVGCDLAGCRNACTLMQHIAGCTAESPCATNGCIETRQLLGHWTGCIRQSCTLCGPIKRRLERNHLERDAEENSGEAPTPEEQSAVAVTPSSAELNRPRSPIAAPQPPTGLVNDSVDAEDHLCSICLENRKNIAFFCGHVCCDKCAKSLVNCHMCRQVILHKLKLYL